MKNRESQSQETFAQHSTNKNNLLSGVLLFIQIIQTQHQTNIENAKTILHECIHAYLFVKLANPTAGMNIVGIINKMYPTYNEQHDFMYNKMLPVMTQILSEIRDFVTFPAGRAEVIDLNMSITPGVYIRWNWDEYYKFISLKGLDETSCFKQDFPNPSNELNLLIRYVTRGNAWLDKK